MGTRLLLLMMVLSAVGVSQYNGDVRGTGASGGNSITSPDAAGDVGRFTSLVLDASGNPVVSYYQAINIFFGALKVLHCGDANCTSGNTITTPDTGDVGKFTSLALDAVGNPVVSYYDDGASNLKVLHCGDPNCASGNVITSPDTAGLVGPHTSLALDSDGYPVISYARDGGFLKVLHCGDPNCVSGNTISTPDSGADFLDTSLALDAVGNPVVSYNDYTNGSLKVLHCGDPNCTSGNVITSPDTAGDVGRFTSLVLDASGNPVVSYFDDTNGNLKVLHCGNANCTSDNVIASPDTADRVGWYTSLALDASGYPVVSYGKIMNRELKVLHCGDPNCTSGNVITSPDTASLVSKFTSLALDASGKPVVSYYNEQINDLKVLHCGDANCTGNKPLPVVVLVHGYDFNSQDEACGMEPLASFIEAVEYIEGGTFKTECLWYRTHWGVEAAAGKLRDRIAGLGVAKVDIVAHSMGGLVARYYIEKLDDGGYRDRVRSLTMLGTPNLGTPWANVACTFALLPLTKGDQGACDMSKSSSLLQDLNDSPGSYEGVSYQVFIGWLGLPGLLAIPNDCVVEYVSARGLSFSTALRAVLHVDRGGPQVFIGCVIGTGIMDDHGVRKEIAAILLASNGLSSQAQTASLAATTAGTPPPDEPGPSTLSVQTGLITAGETVDLDVAMPEGQATGTFVFRSPPSPDATLVYSLLRPGGTPVAESDADASVIAGPGFGGFDETHYVITDPEPGPGTWTMRVFGATVPEGGWPYDMQALVPGGISVVASAGAGHYTTGEPIALSTDVAIGGIPLSSATVNAMVTKPDGTTADVELIGDGSGTYAGSFSDTAACGMYQVVVTASGLDGETPFTRQDRTLATVGVPGNVILDPCNADSDGDGLTDEEELEVYSTNLGDPDTDDDGCMDGQELGSIPSLGGQRNPTYFWDFFDVWTPDPDNPGGYARDKVINIIDIGAIVLRFGSESVPPPTKEEALAEALTAPPDMTSYHAAFDRGGVIPGEDLWDLLPPDGAINILDIGAAVIQFSHTCA